MVGPDAKQQWLRWLSQPEPVTLGLVVLLSVAQAALAASLDGWSLRWLWQVLLLGAPLCSALYQCNLELAQNLCTGSPFWDRSLALAANWVTGVPYAELVRDFQREHLAFHNARCGQDPERPTAWEVEWVHGPARKLLYLALHPLVLGHKLLRRRQQHAGYGTPFGVANVCGQGLLNGWVWYQGGSAALAYLWASTYVGFSPWHPAAFYWLTQHRVCTRTLDLDTRHRTYSYYGWANAFTLNAGYHRERHWGIAVPWTKLPLLRTLVFAAQGPRSAYTSLPEVLHDFVTQPGLTLHS